MQYPLYKIILSDYINPISDYKSSLVRSGAIVLLRQRNLTDVPSYKIIKLGSEKSILREFKNKRSLEIITYKNMLILPGLFDIHFHWVQDDVRLKDKVSLLTWLSKYAWPSEAKFKDKKYCRKKVLDFSQELLRVGTLGGMCYGSIHGHTVDYALKTFIGDFVVGNVLMTMNSPKSLIQSKGQAVQSIMRKSKKYGPDYAVTPRFAVTTDPYIMNKAAVFAKVNNSFIQTHLSESKQEINKVLKIYRDFEEFSNVKHYTEIYEKCGLLGPKTVLGHCIYLNHDELKILKKHGACIAHCPTSNAAVKDLGLGSGLFDFRTVDKLGIKWALGSDIGGGPYLSMFDVIASFVKQNRAVKRYEATYIKGLYRSTKASASILGLINTHGNLSPGNYANLLLLESPKVKKGENCEKILKEIIEDGIKQREDYQQVVLKTIYKGNEVYSKL